MFKKKIWRRGDKLNAKELNRIEEGILNASGNNNSNNIVVEFLSDGEGGIDPDPQIDFAEILAAAQNGATIQGVFKSTQDTRPLYPVQILSDKIIFLTASLYNDTLSIRGIEWDSHGARFKNFE